jgi:mevalonate kinase
VRASGKFILAGEHSIVKRGRALGFPLPLLQIRIEESDAFQGLVLNGEHRSSSNFSQYLSLRQRLGIKKPVRGARVDSEIPIGGGLGSSAALCVALGRLHFPHEDARAIALRALEGERSFHGSPSGLDPFTVAYNRPIVFDVLTQQARPLRLDAAVRDGFYFVLRDSGLRHQTRQVIEALQSLRERAPERVEHAFATLSEIVEASLLAFEEGEAAELGAQMNLAHRSLADLGLSNPELEAAVASLHSEGALGAKLTGAGCGGFALGLFRGPPKTQEASDVVLTSEALALMNR